MAETNFKVRKGLSVGENKATIDATTGDIVTDGSVKLNGSSSGSTTIVAPATGSVLSYVLPSAAGAASTVLTNDGSGNLSWALPGGGGSTFGNVTVGVDTDNTISTTTGDLILDSSSGTVAVNVPTITTDATTLALFNTTATTVNAFGAATTVNMGAGAGIVNVAGDLKVSGNDIQASDGATNITLTSNTLTTFAGDIKVSGNDIQNSTGNTIITMQTGAAARTIFAGDIEIDGNNIRASDGNINITTTSNTLTAFAGDIRVNGNDIQASDGNTAVTLTPVTGFNPNTNITGNLVRNSIRNASAQSAGGIWGFGTTPTGNNLYVGGTIDNTGAPATTNRTGLILRNVNTSTPQAGFIGETARGTIASPTAVQTNDNLVLIGGGGYNGTSWVTDTVSTIPGVINIIAAENWSGTTNVGTSFNVILQPTATTFTTTSRMNIITHNPQSALYRSDTFAFRQGKSFSPTTGGGLYAIQVNPGSTSVGSVVNINSASTDGSKYSVQNFQSVRFDGTNVSATQNNDVLGEYKFNGNTATSGANPSVPGPPGANIVAQANENWSNTANGTNFLFSIIKKGTTTSIGSFRLASDEIRLRGDQLTLQDSNSVALTSAAINYTRTYGEFAYTNAAGFAIAAQNTIYAMPLDTTLNNSGVTTSSTSRVNINVSGWYKIIMSLQAAMTTNSVGQFDFWLRKNGNDVANSKTQVDLLKDQKSVIAMDWLVNSNGSDYWEIVYASSSIHYADISFPTIAATATPGDPYTSPLAPALIINVIPAGA